MTRTSGTPGRSAAGKLPPDAPSSATGAATALDTIASARRVLAIETSALVRIAERLGPDFATAVSLVLACQGRVVVTGMGKSGQICRKLAATFASTGTASFFLHAAEGLHGDIGMFARGDVCIGVSYSGTTDELVGLLPAIKRLALPLIAITGGLESPLAKAADAVLDVSVEEEACPMGLAPTASTTATLAIGDALAITVLEARGFTERDFAMLHPGGALGRKLLRVEDVMHPGGGVPLIEDDATALAALERMTEGRLGVVGVLDASRTLAGVITDGDVRRAILRWRDLSGHDAAAIMTRNPKTIEASALAAEALAVMERHTITSLFIVDRAKRPVGIVHLHDLLRAGIA